MDQEREREVWRRVKGPGGPAPGLNAGEALLPEKLEALILEQRAQAAALRAAAGRLQGPRRGELNRMAARGEARARELTALHYLLTGRRLRLQSPRLPAPGPLPETLRGLCLSLRDSARAFGSLGAEFSAWAGDFSRLSEAAEADGRRLMGLLREELDRPGP